MRRGWGDLNHLISQMLSFVFGFCPFPVLPTILLDKLNHAVDFSGVFLAFGIPFFLNTVFGIFHFKWVASFS
jgi:hypothetical protein